MAISDQILQDCKIAIEAVVNQFVEIYKNNPDPLVVKNYHKEIAHTVTKYIMKAVQARLDAVEMSNKFSEISQEAFKQFTKEIGTDAAI